MPDFFLTILKTHAALHWSLSLQLNFLHHEVEGQCEEHYKLELDNIWLRQKVRHNYSKNLLDVANQIVRTQE